MDATLVAADVPVVVRCVGLAIGHIIIFRICNQICCQYFFPDTMQKWNFITRRVSRPSRETEEGSKSHHTLFRWVYSFCVASLTGRWSITALRGLRPLVPCYARFRPCRDESSFSTILLSAYSTDKWHSLFEK